MYIYMYGYIGWVLGLIGPPPARPEAPEQSSGPLPSSPEDSITSVDL